MCVFVCVVLKRYIQLTVRIYLQLSTKVGLLVCLFISERGEDYYIVIIFCLRVLENARCDDFN